VTDGQLQHFFKIVDSPDHDVCAIPIKPNSFKVFPDLQVKVSRQLF
jgi:hypothetical protein